MKRTLKEWRAKFNLTQSDVAKKIGVSIQTYGVWENNLEIIKMGYATKLAEIFNCKLDDFLFTPEHENNSGEK